MNANRGDGIDARSRQALNDLQGMIRERYPEARFDVAPGDDPEGLYLRTTIDIDDVEEILDVVRDRLFEIQVEEGLPIYVIPLEPIGRVMGDFRAQRSRHARHIPTICFAGTHDPRFTRTAVLAEGLRRHGWVVTECVAPAWGATDARVAAARHGLRNPALLWRLARSYRRVLQLLHARRPRPDTLILGHPGQLDAIVLRALAPRIPVILDAFIAIDETLADRGLGAASSPTRRLARLLDRLAMRAADRVIVDTAAHARRYATDYGLDPARAVLVPVGAFGQGARPHPNPPLPGEGAELRALYFGGFIPLHGVPVILEAARRLDPEEGIHIDLVGDGQQAGEAEAFLRRAQLPHVRLHQTWMSEDDLVERHIAHADVCLGIFASAQKTMDVVPAKVYLALATGRTVLTADTPAVREELLGRAAGAEPVVLCRPGDPDSLAQALRRLRDDPDLRSRVAAAGRRLYEEHFRPERVVEPLISAIADMR